MVVVIFAFEIKHLTNNAVSNVLKKNVMKTIQLSDDDLVMLRAVLSIRLCNLNIDEQTFLRAGLSTTSLHDEILSVSSLLDKLS